MGVELVSGNTYVIEDNCFEVWRKTKKGCEQYEYEYCIAKDIKKSIFGYSFEVSLAGGKNVTISVDNSREKELRDFWEELNSRISKTYDIDKSAKTLAKTAEKAIPKPEIVPTVIVQQQIIREPGFVKKPCPRCGGVNYHAFVEEVTVRPQKIKGKTTLNLNPFKPFTLYNYNEKVVKDEKTKMVSRFVCDDCGEIFSNSWY